MFTTFLIEWPGLTPEQLAREAEADRRYVARETRNARRRAAYAAKKKKAARAAKVQARR